METKKIIVLIVIIVLIIFLGLSIVYTNKKNKHRSKLFEESKLKERLKREKLKEENPDEFERTLKKELDSRNKNKLWKDTRVGLFIFIGIHLIIETILSESTGSSGQPNIGATVGFNYIISQYFIKKSIFKKNKIIDKPILYGIGVSLIVFCFRLLLGVIYYLFINDVL